MTRATRDRLLLVGVFALPPALVQMVRMTTGGAQPAEAPAAVVSVEDAGDDDVSLELDRPRSEEEAASLAWMESVSMVGPMRSPMVKPSTREDEGAGSERTASVVRVEPTFEIGSIIGTGSRGAAMIDGEIRRLGDEVAAGWTLVDIDARAQTVTIASEKGEKKTITR